MNKTAIVIGATGVVGKALITQLCATVEIGKIIAITRRPIEYNSTKVTSKVIDFNQLHEHSSLFNGDILFSCLGTTAKQAGSIKAQRLVDLTYQYQAATLAADQGVSHYLLVSSSGANINSNNAYFQMKGELEEQVSKLALKRISLFRPSLLLGERADFRLAELLGKWLLPIVCLLPGLKKYRPITGQQVAKKMIAVSLQIGESTEIFSLDELFD